MLCCSELINTACNSNRLSCIALLSFALPSVLSPALSSALSSALVSQFFFYGILLRQISLNRCCCCFTWFYFDRFALQMYFQCIQCNCIEAKKTFHCWSCCCQFNKMFVPVRLIFEHDLLIFIHRNFPNALYLRLKFVLSLR